MKKFIKGSPVYPSNYPTKKIYRNTENKAGKLPLRKVLRTPEQITLHP